MEVTPQTCCNQIEVQTWFSSYRLVLTQAISPQQCSLTVNWIVHNFIMWTVKIAARDLTTATWVSFPKICMNSFLNAVSLFTLPTLTSCSGEELVNKTHKEEGNWNPHNCPWHGRNICSCYTSMIPNAIALILIVPEMEDVWCGRRSFVSKPSS